MSPGLASCHPLADLMRPRVGSSLTSYEVAAIARLERGLTGALNALRALASHSGCRGNHALAGCSGCQDFVQAQAVLSAFSDEYLNDAYPPVEKK